ncbi:MAG: tryptophan synthase subunit alpha [Deltaproteobacteria bacterium]|jgi:tryptophan synthase alpha chain|nr:tryptophan synthase subunit alpha [Deltaproteobacteria bacterium]
MTASVLTSAILEARRNGRPALIPFLTGGFPDRESFWPALEELARSGADVIEIGVPFSDPVADGPVVAAASLKALEDGVDLAWILDGLAARRLGVPLVLMSYANPLLQYAWPLTDPAAVLQARVEESLAHFARKAEEAGISGIIVPDMPLEEYGPFLRALAGTSLDPIALVGPNTSPERMARYARVAGGYVYVVSVLGTTGVREGLPQEVVQTLGRARRAFGLPLALGFGIKSPDQLAALGAEPDAVIIGSALLAHLGAGGDCRGFMAPWLAY